MQNYSANNNGVQLHYVGNKDSADAMAPLVYIPGGLGTAEDPAPGMLELAPRQVFPVSLRGRGKSDAPESGYAFEDHVADLEAIVEDIIEGIGANHVYLYGYSMSVPIAIEYAARHPERIAGILLGDYPALYPAISAEWPERVIAHGAKPHVAHGIQKEAQQAVLWDRLKEITAPILYMYGCGEGAFIKEDGGKFIQEMVPHATFAAFKESGHELWEPDQEHYVSVIREFLAQADEALKEEENRIF